MGLDDEDTPNGEIIALVLVAAVVILVVVFTFESCSDFEMGSEHNYCKSAHIELGPILGEDGICFNTDGEVEFSVLNRGTIPVEILELRYRDEIVNVSVQLGPISQQNIIHDFNLRIGQEYTPINVTPIVYYEPSNSLIRCSDGLQRIIRLRRCGDNT